MPKKSKADFTASHAQIFDSQCLGLEFLIRVLASLKFYHSILLIYVGSHSLIQYFFYSKSQEDMSLGSVTE